MHQAIGTVSVGGALPHKLAAITAARFDGIELFDNDLISATLAPKEVATRCADVGFTTSRFAEAWDVVQRADHPSVGVVVDTFHMVSRGAGAEALADVPG